MGILRDTDVVGKKKQKNKLVTKKKKTTAHGQWRRSYEKERHGTLSRRTGKEQPPADMRDDKTATTTTNHTHIPLPSLPPRIPCPDSKTHYQVFFWVLIDLIVEFLGLDYQAL
jgi:hypothetical protein